jgi:hypothetical protein
MIMVVLTEIFLWIDRLQHLFLKQMKNDCIVKKGHATALCEKDEKTILKILNKTRPKCYLRLRGKRRK